MFKFLKNKLKNWTEKISKESEEVEEAPLEEAKKIEKSVQKKKETSKEEIEVPMKFNEGMQQFQPDVEKIKEIPKKVEEPEKETPKPGTKSFFKRVTSRISKVKISEKEFDIYADELETLLLENNVAFEVTEEIIKKLKENIVGKEFLKKEIEEEIKDSLKNIIQEILIEPFDFFCQIKRFN